MRPAKSACLYLDTSAVLRAVLENGISPEVEAMIAAAPALITSRLSLVESARALHRLRRLGAVGEEKLADAEREISTVWERCELWEMTPAVCAKAAQVHLESCCELLTQFISPLSCWPGKKWKVSNS